MLFSSFISVVAAAISVAAHGGVTSIIIGGTTYTGWSVPSNQPFSTILMHLAIRSPYNDPTNQTSIERPYSSYDPILSATGATMSCNNNGTASAKQLSATVVAGTSITGVWSQWTHAEGPVTVYMAACGGNCTSKTSSALNWFKYARLYLYPRVFSNLANLLIGSQRLV